MFECGTYEYGLKTVDLSEKEMVKIFEKALSKIAGEINDSRIPKMRKLRKMTGPFGRSATLNPPFCGLSRLKNPASEKRSATMKNTTRHTAAG